MERTDINGKEEDDVEIKGEEKDDVETVEDAFVEEALATLSTFTAAGRNIVDKALEFLPGLELSGTSAAAPVEKTPLLETGEFARRARQLMAKIDTNGDDCLSTAELAKAVQDKQFKGQDAQVVAALYENRDELKNLNDDQVFESGVTFRDLARFGAIERKHRVHERAARDAKEWLEDEDKFKRVDTNGNGFLSKDELIKASKQSNLSGEERELLSYMRYRVDSIQLESDDEWLPEQCGITRKDLEAHIKSASSSDEVQMLRAVKGVMERTSDSQRQGGDDLYGGKKAADSIKPEAIDQGFVGDCYFLASLASVAKSNPALIEKMIEDNKNGTYTVTFPGAANYPITVEAPTQAEAGLYNGVGENGTWALVMEKAYGKYCQQNIYRRLPFNPGGGNTPVEGGDGGGFCSTSMKLLTGEGTTSLTTAFSWRSQMQKQLEDAFSSNPPRAVTAGICKSTLSDGKSHETVDGFPMGHAYSILGFDRTGPGGGTVTIRNPWGGADGSPKGTIQISLDKFRKNFSELVIQKS